jgi:hypothetical protein
MFPDLLFPDLLWGEVRIYIGGMVAVRSMGREIFSRGTRPGFLQDAFTGVHNIRIVLLLEKPYLKYARIGPGFLFSGSTPAREIPQNRPVSVRVENTFDLSPVCRNTPVFDAR